MIHPGTTAVRPSGGRAGPPFAVPPPRPHGTVTGAAHVAHWRCNGERGRRGRYAGQDGEQACRGRPEGTRRRARSGRALAPGTRTGARLLRRLPGRPLHPGRRRRTALRQRVRGRAPVPVRPAGRLRPQRALPGRRRPPHRPPRLARPPGPRRLRGGPAHTGLRPLRGRAARPRRGRHRVPAGRHRAPRRLRRHATRVSGTDRRRRHPARPARPRGRRRTAPTRSASPWTAAMSRSAPTSCGCSG